MSNSNIKVNTIKEVIEKVKYGFQNKDNIYLVGPSGFGKTAIITQQAEASGYEIITIYSGSLSTQYLRCIPSDENIESDNNSLQEVPYFLVPVLENPTKKYLLFLENLNTATVEVLNAIYKIIKKDFLDKYFPNLLVFATGFLLEDWPYIIDIPQDLYNQFIAYEFPKDWGAFIDYIGGK